MVETIMSSDSHGHKNIDGFFNEGYNKSPFSDPQKKWFVLKWATQKIHGLSRCLVTYIIRDITMISSKNTMIDITSVRKNTILSKNTIFVL